MKVLFVDTTTPDLVVAIVTDSEVKTFGIEKCGTHHSEKLCDCVNVAMTECGLAFEDLDAYACAIGPGSFTGIRIGISTVKGFCVAVNKPYIAVNCLQAISISQNCGKKGFATIDAGNGYYFADYVNGVEPCLVPYDDERAIGAGKCGSAVDYFDGAVQIIRDRYAQETFSAELSPTYIRRSQAEDNRCKN